MPTVSDPIKTALEQMSIARTEITLGVARLRAAETLSPDCANMASAILEYFAMQIALENAQAEDAIVLLHAVN